MWNAATQNRWRTYKIVDIPRNWDGSDMLHDWRQWQLPRTDAGDDHATIMVNRNSANIAYTFQFYICLCIGDRDCCSAADGNGNAIDSRRHFQIDDMLPTSSQKHHSRWPGNPNGRSKCCKYHAYLPSLRPFTSMRSRLVLCGWRQQQLQWTRAVVFWRVDTLPTSKTSPAMTRIDRNSTITKMYAYEIKQNL